MWDHFSRLETPSGRLKKLELSVGSQKAKRNHVFSLTVPPPGSGRYDAGSQNLTFLLVPSTPHAVTFLVVQGILPLQCIALPGKTPFPMAQLSSLYLTGDWLLSEVVWRGAVPGSYLHTCAFLRGVILCANMSTHFGGFHSPSSLNHSLPLP